MPLTNRQRASVLDRWIPRSQRKARGTATGGRDAQAPAHRLAYYATTLPGKENWHQTDEGYRTYTNVPICRTGSQLYRGRELKKNEGYNPAWGLRDDEMVEVFCPVEELTSRETLASFENKSVLDEHPFGDKILVNALDEYDGYTKGHGHNVRVGDVLDEGEFAGETPLIADLTVKHPDLNVKIEGGIREVSCAYTFSLDKAEGRFVKRKIRGNHIAVVPKGRAGPEIGIKDSAPPSTTTANTGAKMKNLLKIVGLGFQNFAKDAKPEEVGELLEQMREGDGVADAAVVDTKSKAFTDAVASGVKDAMAAKDAEDEAGKKKKDDDEKAAKDAEKECESMADGFEEKKEEEGAKDDAVVIPSMSESIFSVGDAATHLGAIRPLIARSKDKAAIASFNKLAKSVKSLRAGVKDSALPDPFAALTRPSNSAVADAEPEVPMFTFFNGVPYEEGLKRWNEHQKSKGAR